MTNTPPLGRNFRLFVFRNRDISKGRPCLVPICEADFPCFVDFNKSKNLVRSPFPSVGSARLIPVVDPLLQQLVL